MRLRVAGAEDAGKIALLHANSWRLHYRGAFADSFLDGDIVADRLEVWSARLAAPADGVTIVAESGSVPGLVGFVHVALNADARWGSLLDNLHVVPQLHRRGVGKALVTSAAQAVLEKAASPAMFLWVLEQNVAAQGFYRAMGGTCVERARVNPPGGVPDRLNGEPMSFRFAWPDVAPLAPALRG